MRVWLYYRLSNDDDPEQNSLFNQRNICYGFAESNGHYIVGESSDDNISGMKFNRPGLSQLTEAVEKNLIDAVVVKDMARLGRHKTQTAMFIDFLREHHVRVLSVTERLDTFQESDDLVIGVRGLIESFSQCPWHSSRSSDSAPRWSGRPRPGACSDSPSPTGLPHSAAGDSR